jgi:hypothetical protein
MKRSLLTTAAIIALLPAFAAAQPVTPTPGVAPLGVAPAASTDTAAAAGAPAEDIIVTGTHW